MRFDKQEELSSSAVSNDGKGKDTTYVFTMTAMAVSGRMCDVLSRPITVSLKTLQLPRFVVVREKGRKRLKPPHMDVGADGRLILFLFEDAPITGDK